MRLKPVIGDQDDEEFEDIMDEDQDDQVNTDQILDCSFFFFFIPADGDVNREFIYFDSKADIINSMQGV